MKYIQSAVVIAALLNNSKAVSLKSNQNVQHVSKSEMVAAEQALLQMTYNQKKSEVSAKAMNLTDEQLVERVHATLAQAKIEA